MSTQSKHFLNDSSTIVLKSLQGLCSINPYISLDAENKVVYSTTYERNKVALMCGGGSGHEPSHAGFVGPGMLTSAVCGNIFASPNPSQVRRGIELIDNEKGTLIIVKNYTGDVLNFGLAKEQHAALHPEKSKRIKFVIVGDDVAVGKTQGKIVGRRGLAGTVLVYKIAGALAERGKSLDEVYDMAQWVAKNVATIGVSLGHTHVPGNAPLASDLSFSEIEIGMGIHNESGHTRLSPVPSLPELVQRLLDLLTSTTDPERSFVPFKGNDNIVLLVNNLGGVSELELSGIVDETRKALVARGLKIHRILSGAFMTSLNMNGFSITLLLLPTDSDTSASSTSLVTSLLDDRPKVPGWHWYSGTSPSPHHAALTATSDVKPKDQQFQLQAYDAAIFVSSIKRAALNLINNEPEITRMDTIAGDGDCGLTLKAGAEAVLRKLEDRTIDGNDVIKCVITISQIAEDTMGGTSGALYSIFFSSLAQELQHNASKSGKAVTAELWSKSLVSSLANLYTYTRARPPSRTLVDPLAEFITVFSENPASNFRKAVSAASRAAEETKHMEAKAGRSAYVGHDRLKQEQVPDPGAWGVKTILESFDA